MLYRFSTSLFASPLVLTFTIIAGFAEIARVFFQNGVVILHKDNSILLCKMPAARALHRSKAMKWKMRAAQRITRSGQVRESGAPTQIL